MNNDNFWNDQRAFEFAFQLAGKMQDNKYFAFLDKEVKDFKESKALPVVPEYEILSYLNNTDKIVIRKMGTEIFKDNDGVTYPEHYFSAHPELFSILSVKRKDGEVFSWGERVTYRGLIYLITSFSLFYSETIVHVDLDGLKRGCYLSDIEKIKEPIPLFTTYDKVNIFKGEKYFWINDVKDGSWTPWEHVAGEEGDTYDVGKCFSTRDAATEYVVLNKSIFSYQQIMNRLHAYFKNAEMASANLKQYAKEKIKA